MLSDRQLQILQVIVDDFIQTAQPIGSRAISKKDHVSYSSATIRNEMADLEEMGFLEKTHSSSGRIPSEKGYRFYVDHLLAPFRMSKKDLTLIREAFNDHLIELEHTVQRAATILSELSNYTSIVLGPEVYETKLKQLEIIPLNDQSAVAILVTNTGHVEHRSFTVPEGVDPSDIQIMVNILNERLVGVPIVQLNDFINTEIATLLRKHTNNFEKSYKLLHTALFEKRPTRLYVGGKTNMLAQPEFKDVNQIRTLLSIIEQEKEIAPIIRQNNEGVRVVIGQENKVQAMQNCSLITASYTFGDEQLGTIAILGPTRMEYSRVISLLNVLSGQMSKTFQSWYQNGS